MDDKFDLAREEQDRAVFGFECNGRLGKVVVSCVPNPQEGTGGFPTCTATADFEAEGYDAFLGWMQLVLSTDNKSGGKEFDMDPFFLFQDTPSPYCFYGFKPTLFDAPSRQTKNPIAWLAHSFLAATPFEPKLMIDLKHRRVVPLLGFSWGFDINDQGAIVLRPIKKLGAAHLNQHLSFLRGRYPTWKFDAVTEIA